MLYKKYMYVCTYIHTCIVQYRTSTYDIYSILLCTYVSQNVARLVGIINAENPPLPPDRILGHASHIPSPPFLLFVYFFFHYFFFNFFTAHSHFPFTSEI